MAMMFFVYFYTLKSLKHNTAIKKFVLLAKQIKGTFSGLGRLRLDTPTKESITAGTISSFEKISPGQFIQDNIGIKSLLIS